MNFIKKWLNYIENRKLTYGYIGRQILPVFHDRFRSTNKDFVELSEEARRIKKHGLETQDEVPVKFYKGFKEGLGGSKKGKHIGDESFSVGGMIQGKVVRIMGGGFLETTDDVYEVVLVTDKFVYMKNLRVNWITIKSHAEIERMTDMGGMI